MKKLNKKDMDALYIIYLDKCLGVGTRHHAEALDKKELLQNALDEYTMAIVEDTFYSTLRFVQSITRE